MSRGRQPERFLATILFTDIVGSTDVASRVGDREWRRLIAAHQKAVRAQLKRFGGREIDTAGDGFFASFDQPAQAVRAADAIVAETTRLGLGLRAGVHTGECEMIGRKVGGIAVHIAARVMAAAATREVLVSSTVRDLVAGSGLTFEDRGVHELKGVPEEWHLYALVSLQADASVQLAGSGVASAEAATEQEAKRRRSTVLLIGGLAGTFAALMAVVVLALVNRGAAAPQEPGPNTLLTLDGSGKVVDVRSVPAGPVAVAVDGDKLWVASLDAGVISSLPVNGSSDTQQSVGRVGQPTALAVGAGQIWGADAFDQSVTLIDSGTGAINRTVPSIEARDIAFASDSAWATDDLSDQVQRLDGVSGDPIGSIALDAGAYPRAIAATEDAIWVANAGTSTVTRIDPVAATVVAGAIPLRFAPDAIAATASDVWIASNGSDTIMRLDPATNSVAATVTVCDQPMALATDGDGVWVACGGPGEIWHLDHDGATLSSTDVGGIPTDVVATDGQIFVTVRR